MLFLDMHLNSGNLSVLERFSALVALEFFPSLFSGSEKAMIVAFCKNSLISAHNHWCFAPFGLVGFLKEHASKAGELFDFFKLFSIQLL